MKKIFMLLMLSTTIFLLSSCQKPVNTSVDRTVKTNFISKTNEFELADSEVKLFYLADDLNPYIDVRLYIKMLSGVYYSRDFEFVEVEGKDVLTINYEPSFSEDLEVYYSLHIDFDTDIITVNDMDFFEYYIVYPNTEYSEGLVDLPSVMTKGSSVKYDLGLYNFDLIVNKYGYLIPLSIANLLFNQSIYFDTYYNGDNIYGVDTSDMDDELINEITKSSFNGKDTHQSILNSSYYFYEFIIDYFYGLKKDRNIISGSDFLKRHKSNLLSNKVNQTINDVVYEIDDLHTSHMIKGYYKKKFESNYYRPSLNDFKGNVSKFYDGLFKVTDEANEYFGSTLSGDPKFKEYELIDNNTAVIYLDAFELDTPENVESILISLPNTVTDVIIDLSYNTGGNLGAVLRVFALMTNEEIKYHTQNPLNGSKGTYTVKGENPAYDQFNYYIKTSSVTYSAANLMASMAKELNIPVIGQKSSGGASSISFFVFPQGSIIIMSSNMVLSKFVDGEYLSIEKGIEVNYPLNYLYNKREILDAINSFK